VLDVAVPLAGGVVEVVTAYSYPFDGAGEGASHPTVAVVAVRLEAFKLDG